MHSYILKTLANNAMLLVYRVNGDIIDTKEIPIHKITPYMQNGLIERDHIILHYASVNSTELQQLLLD